MEDITFSGPVFDGRADDALRKGAEDIAQKIAELARDKARDIQLSSIRVEHTGAEPASLHVEGSSLHKEVTDSHAIKYGPWLEGTSERNDTTRFPGYHALRRASEETDMEAEPKAEEVIQPYIDLMNE